MPVSLSAGSEPEAVSCAFAVASSEALLLADNCGDPQWPRAGSGGPDPAEGWWRVARQTLPAPTKLVHWAALGFRSPLALGSVACDASTMLRALQGSGGFAGMEVLEDASKEAWDTNEREGEGACGQMSP
mmetsp:Transcript_35819/g.94936  ORF Transcript_35819/g.94936 Transcript_35819/m.94936 type:complete len:130 (+) Transcript_35819:248-637(+)